MLNFSNLISNDFIGVTWDVGNSVSVLQSPNEFFTITNNIIKNVHLKDYKVYKSKHGISLVRCPLVEGYVDYIVHFHHQGYLEFWKVFCRFTLDL